MSASSSRSFVHLHNHTEYSMLDGAAKVNPMLAEAQRLEMPAIGMTDHGNMFGASEFYNAATDVDIKPIIGVEAYIAPASRFDTKRVLWGDPSQKSDDVSGSGASFPPEQPHRARPAALALARREGPEPRP